jgi:hypothetical protein
MYSQEKNRISDSIINQLQIKDVVITTVITKIIDNSEVTNYDSIKLLSKSIKEKLKDLGVEIQHNKLLNIIAKSIGYQNHHSMKANFRIPDIKNIEIDERDSFIKKLFLIKDEFINKYNFDSTHITTNPSNEHEFKFVFNKEGLKLRSKEKTEINKYLSSYGIKTYKNQILLSKIKHDNIKMVAYNILQQYQNFFEPIWYENDNTLNNYDSLLNNWYMISYSTIEHRKDSYLIVDSYSSDLYWNIVRNFLEYVFNFGTLKDVEFFENCLKQEYYTQKKETVKNLADVSRVYEWEREKVLSSLVKNKDKTIKNTLEAIKYKISIMKYMKPFLEKLESSNNKTIKNIIIENCDYFFNLENKYDYDSIKEKLFLDLLKKKKTDFFNLMEDSKDSEIYQTYYDMYNCIKMITNEIIHLIKMYKDVDKNYSKYLNEFRKKGFMY